MNAARWTTVRRAAACVLALAGGVLVAYVLRWGPEDAPRRFALLALVATGIAMCVTGLVRIHLPVRPGVRLVAVGCAAILFGATVMLGQAIDARVAQFVPREDAVLRARTDEWRRTVDALMWITAYLTTSALVLPGQKPR